MNFLRPNKTKTVIFLAFALSMIVSNACLALYIPIEADLTSDSGFFVDSEIRPVNVCDSHWLNAVGRYRAILFAPLLGSSGHIDFAALHPARTFIRVAGFGSSFRLCNYLPRCDSGC